MRGSDTAELIFDGCEVPNGEEITVRLQDSNTHSEACREYTRSSGQWSSGPHVWFGPRTTSSVWRTSWVSFSSFIHIDPVDLIT